MLHTLQLALSGSNGVHPLVWPRDNFNIFNNFEILLTVHSINTSASAQIRLM